MFHDEDAVRKAAFESIGVAISSGLFSSTKSISISVRFEWSLLSSFNKPS